MAVPRRRQDLRRLDRHLRQTGPSSTMNAARCLLSARRTIIESVRRFRDLNVLPAARPTTRRRGPPWTDADTRPTGLRGARASELLDQLTPAERLGPAAPARRPRPPRRARAVPHRHRGAARRRVAGDGHHVPAARRARRDLGRRPAGARRRRRRHRGPGQARGRPDRHAERLGAGGQPAAPPALGPQRGGVLRGPAPHRRTSPPPTPAACAATTRPTGARSRRSSTSSPTGTRPTAASPARSCRPGCCTSTSCPRSAARSRPAWSGAVMPSYNLVNGRPTTSPASCSTRSAAWTPASLLVVSDAGAPTNLVVGERYYDDHVEPARRRAAGRRRLVHRPRRRRRPGRSRT